VLYRILGLDKRTARFETKGVAAVELKNISRKFVPRKGDQVIAVDEVSLAISSGEFMALVGPSGSGKTTMLRMVAGLEKPSEGQIMLGGKPADGLEPHERNVAMLAQNPALLPHLTAGENMSLGLKLRHVAAEDATRRVQEAAELLSLTRLLNRLPRELSGGERQRVALARAFVRRPAIFLFDEPLSNLDGPMRAQLRIDIAWLHQHLRPTIIYVTHDQAEAMTLGERVAVLRQGALQQVDAPMTLYRSPANAFVASFMGSPPMNLLRGHVIRRGDDYVFIENNVAGMKNGLRMELLLDKERGTRLASIADGNVIMGIRPESLRVTAEENGPVASATAVLLERLGSATLLHLTTGAHTFIARLGPEFETKRGDRLKVALNLQQAVFFNPVSEKIVA
jgi:multiple sugar transport system ATP-binding protein